MFLSYKVPAPHARRPTATDDLADWLFGGVGDDLLFGGHGNDELRGDNGHDTLYGGHGANLLVGGAHNDVLAGSEFGDTLFGGSGTDFLNGGFGHDRLNGGADADRFFHLGVEGHGSDWVQDYSAMDGDVLQFGGSANRDDFRVSFGETEGAVAEGAEEAFVIYKPTGQLLWALVDGAAQTEFNILIGGTEFDLLA